MPRIADLPTTISNEEWIEFVNRTKVDADPHNENTDTNASYFRLLIQVLQGAIPEKDVAGTWTAIQDFAAGIEVDSITNSSTNGDVTVQMTGSGLFKYGGTGATKEVANKEYVLQAINGVGGAVLMTGASAGSDGVAGLVTKPLLGEQTFVLLGSGVWTNISTRTETLTNKTISGASNTLSNIAIASIASSSKTGTASRLVTAEPSAFSSLNLVASDASGNAIDSNIATIVAKPLVGIAAAKTVLNTTYSSVPEFAIATTIGRVYEWEIIAAFDIETTCGFKAIVIPPGGSNNPYVHMLTVIEGSSGAAVLKGGRDPSSNAVTHVPAGAGTFAFTSRGVFTSTGGSFDFQFANNASGGANIVALRAGSALILRCLG